MRLTRDAQRRMGAGLFVLALLLLGWGCSKRATDTPPPPPGKSGSSLGLQNAYNNPSLASSGTNQPNQPKRPVTIQRLNVKIGKNTPMLGDKDAPVTIVEWSDFQ